MAVPTSSCLLLDASIIFTLQQHQLLLQPPLHCRSLLMLHPLWYCCSYCCRFACRRTGCSSRIKWATAIKPVRKVLCRNYDPLLILSMWAAHLLLHLDIQEHQHSNIFVSHKGGLSFDGQADTALQSKDMILETCRPPPLGTPCPPSQTCITHAHSLAVLSTSFLDTCAPGIPWPPSHSQASHMPIALQSKPTTTVPLPNSLHQPHGLVSRKGGPGMFVLTPQCAVAIHALTVQQPFQHQVGARVSSKG